MVMIAISVVGFTACSDSDNDDVVKPDPAPATEFEVNAGQRMALASVLNALTGLEFNDTTDIDFENRTFEANCGELRDHSRLWERCLMVRSAVLAESYFKALVNDSALMKTTDDGYIVDMTSLDTHSSGHKQNFGKLTFHRGTGADNVGYVDVEIPCIPGLERITYKTQEQWGDNGSFESPISYGEVFFGDGLYWICVREATGNHSSLCGVLVNMQPGKGDGWEPIYNDEKWAAWRANSHRNSFWKEAILDYINLCGDGSFTRQKRRIMAKPFGSKVFPCGQVWHKPQDIWVLQDVEGAGFGDIEHGAYCHWANWPSYENGIAIVRDATEGNYRVGHGWWRRWHLCCTSVSNEKAEEPDARISGSNWKRPDVSSFKFFDYYYTNTNDFYKFGDHVLMYTTRCEIFITGIPHGFTKIDI